MRDRAGPRGQREGRAACRSGSSAAAATATAPPTPWRPSGTSRRVPVREPAGWVGAAGGRGAPSPWPGSARRDVDVAEFYDPFSFEIIRQLEAYGFCARGEGGPMVESGAIAPGGTLPVTTDGGTMSFSHAGHRGPAVPARHPRRAAAPRRVPDLPGRRRRRRVCARTAAPAPCSPTCCSWGKERP